MILENVPHLWLFSADTIDFTQTSVKGFRQHPTTLLYGFEGVWLDKRDASREIGARVASIERLGT